MKKIMVCFVGLVFSITCLCQKTNDSVPTVEKDYLQKSKNQKTAGWILLGGGTALIVTGFIIGNGENSTFDDAAEGALLAGVGVLSALGSIPLFVASGRNKKIAMKMTTRIKMENTAIPEKQSLAQRSYPALAFKISL